MPWKIEFVEKPLKIGPIDNMIYRGKDASHSFLRLIDDEGRVAGELHGFSYDPDTGQKVDFNFNPFKRLQHIFSREAKPFQLNSVKIFHFDFERTKHPELVPQTICEGAEDEVLAKWIAAIKRGVDLNSTEHEYRPFSFFDFWTAQNCHTTSQDLMNVMGLQLAQTPKYATPGLERQFSSAARSLGQRAISHGVSYLDSLRGALGYWSQKFMEASAPEKIQHGKTPYILGDGLHDTPAHHA